MVADPQQSGVVDIVVRATLGGVLIAALLSLARLRQYVLTGLLVSMPVVSLYTWWWIGHEQGAASLRVAVRAAIFGAIPWAAYLGVVYVLAGKVPLWLALASGWAVWLVIALLFWMVLQGRA